MTIPSQHTTPGTTFTPYVPATDAPKEFSLGAIVLGVLLGLVFAASSVYLALKVSLTVSASIPIAVLSITIFRYVSRAFGIQPATILQNNLVQTTGSAGESIAAGIAFTLPARLKINRWTDKVIERRLADTIFPKHIARRTKLPFYLPVEFFFDYFDPANPLFQLVI